MRDLPTVVDAPEALSPDMLTALLGSDGARVRSVTRGGVWEGGYSIAYQLLLDWGGGAGDPGPTPRGTPAGVVLKVPRSDVPAEWTARNARQEYHFYRELAALTPRVPTIGCYAGAYDAEQGTYCLLLEDMSGSHTTPRAQNAVPPPDHAAQALEGLARLHASWWDDPRLATLAATERTENGSALGTSGASGAPSAIAVDTERAVEAFLRYLGDALPEPRRRALRDIAAFLPEVIARQRAGPMTLVHGDANWRNFLFPRDPGGTVLLFDWQTWTVASPVVDLGYMMGRHWTDEPNVDLVEALLRRYHQTLLAQGVSSAAYPWRRCWDDFRLALVRPPTGAAVAWFRWGSLSDPPEQWLRYTQRVFVLHDALDCAALVPARA